MKKLIIIYSAAFVINAGIVYELLSLGLDLLVFLPIIASYIATKSFFRKNDRRYKIYFFLLLALVLTLTSRFFCWYNYHYGTLDDGDVVFVEVFTFLFGAIPCLLISLVSHLRGFRDK